MARAGHGGKVIMSWEDRSNHVCTLKDQLADDLVSIKDEGLFKAEAVIGTPQSARIGVGDQTLINFCANNYLGLLITQP